LIVNIHVHSAFKRFFPSKSFSTDLSTYSELITYLHAMHKSFIGFIKQQLVNGETDCFVILDKDFNIISIEELMIRVPKKNDKIYIVPTIVGGGGDNGLMTVLLGVALVASAGTLAPAIGGVLGAAAGGALEATIAGTITNIGINLILSGFVAMFTKKSGNKDKASRNDMFSSLSNSTTSDTPVALHYGEVRVAGQFISGYIQAIEHGKSEVIKVGNFFG